MNHASIAFHDVLAPDWDSKYASGSFRRRAEFFKREIMPFIIREGRWLDAGCGSGYFARLLGARGLRVTGVDASAPMIEAATRLANSATLSGALDFQPIGDLRRLPFADNSFAGCLCLSVLEYLDRADECLDELTRVLEPGGSLIVSIPSRYSAVRSLQRLLLRLRAAAVQPQLDYNRLSKHSTTPGELQQKLSRCGLRLEAMLGFDPIIPRALTPRFAAGLLFAVAVKSQ